MNERIIVYMDRKEIGRLGETLARQYLERKGYGIVALNYRVGRLGEIDLIVTREETTIFVEVKTRTGNAYGTPAEAISSKKRKTLRQVAACFLKSRGSMDKPVRFDVMEVLLKKDGTLIKINHLEGVL